MKTRHVDDSRTFLSGLARRPAQAAPRHARRSTDATEDPSGAVFDEHGNELYLLACVLTEDPDLAEELVIQAIMAHRGGPSTLREFSAAVHEAWWAWGPESRTVDRQLLDDSSASETILHELHGLPDDQRSALALCRFGDHTYRQAAERLGRPAKEVALLLCEALRTLACPGERLLEPSPAA
ncbi:sigma factor-like helix-turn-helix DNA-binding protein [Aeromicrobium sp.]|uniref:RNA polymerase sigma factor n=1 Tax=Aeromicrobium sp. TaxID=1871063 RepID=UPI0019BD57FE|nr:sigma factor-like helix-turn-helix DNA-binding protein [Aeromicrobium sp.]MBC7629905.1 hypothetical protein [Aeromicrobium sp.]